MTIPESLKEAMVAWYRSADMDPDAALLALAQAVNPGVGFLRSTGGIPLLQLTDKAGKRGVTMKLDDASRKRLAELKKKALRGDLPPTEEKEILMLLDLEMAGFKESRKPKNRV